MEPFRQRLLFYTLWVLLTILITANSSLAAEQKYALNLYGAKLTSNNWEEFFFNADQIDFVPSEIFVASLAKRLNCSEKNIHYEIEGQVAKHDGIQRRWELNGLGVARWEPFWWDRFWRPAPHSGWASPTRPKSRKQRGKSKAAPNNGCSTG